MSRVRTAHSKTDSHPTLETAVTLHHFSLAYVSVPGAIPMMSAFWASIYGLLAARESN